MSPVIECMCACKRESTATNCGDGSFCREQCANERFQIRARISRALPEVTARENQELDVLGSNRRDIEIGNDSEPAHRDDWRARETDRADRALAPAPKFGERVGRFPVGKAVEDHNVDRALGCHSFVMSAVYVVIFDGFADWE